MGGGSSQSRRMGASTYEQSSTAAAPRQIRATGTPNAERSSATTLRRRQPPAHLGDHVADASASVWSQREPHRLRHCLRCPLWARQQRGDGHTSRGQSVGTSIATLADNACGGTWRCHVQHSANGGGDVLRRLASRKMSQAICRRPGASQCWTIAAADSTPPVVTLTLPAVPSGQAGFFNGSQVPVIGSVSATDPSGVTCDHLHRLRQWDNARASQLGFADCLDQRQRDAQHLVHSNRRSR